MSLFEKDAWAPIVSVLLGLPAVFLWGGLRRSGLVCRIRLENGDLSRAANDITVTWERHSGSVTRRSWRALTFSIT